MLAATTEAAAPQTAASQSFPAFLLPQALPDLASIPQHIETAAADAAHHTVGAASNFVTAQKQTLEGVGADAHAAASNTESMVKTAADHAGSAVTGIPGDIAGWVASGLNRLAAGELHAAGVTETAAAAVGAQEHLQQGVASVASHADKHMHGSEGAQHAGQASTMQSSMPAVAADQHILEPPHIPSMMAANTAASTTAETGALLSLPQEASLPNPLGPGRKLLNQVSMPQLSRDCHSPCIWKELYACRVHKLTAHIINVG